MEAAAATTVPHRHRPVHRPVYYQRPSYSRPIYSLSFRAPPPPPSSTSSTKSSLSITASSSSSCSSSSSSSSFSDPLYPNPKSPKPQLTETLKPLPVSILKTAVAAAIAATAVFFVQFNLKANVATAISPPPVVETANKETISGEENERDLEEYLSSHPEDVQALRNLMEAKIKNRKVDEAIGIVEQLIRLEPEDIEWPLMKAHLHIYNGELEVAKVIFNEIIEKDPAKVEAYHGLVMAASQADSGRELKEIEKRVGEAMEVCKRKKRKGDFRDFKLLIAQIRVIEGNYDAALRVYRELVKEEPRDFRPYLCQGIIYTLLRKNDEAEKQFEKYRRLVPKGHPYAQYFDDNMIATKVFGQKVENERASSKS